MRHAMTFSIGAILALAGAVATGSPAAAETSTGASHVSVTLKEMSVQLSTATVPAGPVTFDITNTGAAEHEFVILKTDIDAAALPEADEEGKATEIGHVDEIDPVPSGESRSLSVTLGPGNYLLVCNKPGHYAAGMRAAFTVSAGISATVKEMSITLGQKFVAPGSVTFSVTNTGSAIHEFVILKADVADGALPPSTDEPGKAEEPGHVAEVEDIGPGQTATLTVTLDPGKYVLICNMPGHYAAGMHASFIVLPGLSRETKANIDQALAARGFEDFEDMQALIDVNALLRAPGVVVTDLDRAVIASGILPRAVGTGGALLY